MDVACWGLGKNELPKRIHSSGGKYVYDDDQETPNTQLATFEYDDGTKRLSKSTSDVRIGISSLYGRKPISEMMMIAWPD